MRGIHKWSKGRRTVDDESRYDVQPKSYSADNQDEERFRDFFRLDQPFDGLRDDRKTKAGEEGAVEEGACDRRALEAERVIGRNTVFAVGKAEGDQRDDEADEVCRRTRQFCLREIKDDARHTAYDVEGVGNEDERVLAETDDNLDHEEGCRDTDCNLEFARFGEGEHGSERVVREGGDCNAREVERE